MCSSEDQLLQSLRDGSKKEKIAAAASLAEQARTRVAEDALLAAATDESWVVRQAALASLARIAPDIPATRLAPLIQTRQGQEHDAPTAEQLLTSGLWRFQSLNPVETLIAEIDVPTPLRPAFVSALGDFGDVRAVEPLIRVLRDESAGPGTRQAAAEALGKIQDPRALDALITALDDRSRSVRRAAISSLASSQGDVEEALRPIASFSGRRGRGARRALRRMRR
jgi:HEAT repeat protein